MMKVILIRPPRPKSDTSFVSLQFPLNLGYLGSFLLGRGVAVEIWDYEVQDLSAPELCARLKKQPPDLIGITCFTPTIMAAHQIAGSIKKAYPAMPVVVGGAHPTALPRETLTEFNNFDIAVIGEGEQTLWELLQAFNQQRTLAGIQGIAYRTQQGEVKVEQERACWEDLNQILPPARNLVNQHFYTGHHVSRAFSRRFLKISEIMATRGCPYSCIFCASHYRRVRFRKVENVLAEAQECIRQYQTTHFSFLDETITIDGQFIEQLCQGLRKLKGISWDCFARVNTVSYDMLRLMVEAGCQKISFGVESGSPRILELLKKNITVEQVKNAFVWSRQAQVKYVEASFMIGSHPQETREDINLTTKLIYEIEPDILMLAIMVPYPGTEIYQIMKDGGYFDQELRWDDFAFFSYRPAWRTDYFSSDELVRLHRELLRKFYLRPKYVLKIISKTRSPIELLYWINEGLDFIKRTHLR